MKSHMHSRGKVGSRVNPQQVIFELKHRVVLALNKLADRDTYQIGAEELERIAEGLNPEQAVPFLSCVIETDSEQKSAVRKECVRIMGTLARFHGALLGPHLGKMIGSIVKRLKDPDSAVKDTCVETVGVLASKISNCSGEGDGPFVALVKPLFEALGEQNRQVQSGCALCLAKVIDTANDPPVALLLRMLTRIIKLLKNQHFMAKPALIELIRSIIQAGGASTGHALSAAITSIQETLKSNDWTTRKAASVALAGLAASCGSLLVSFRASCILSLESCRFDKVKPVRDSVMQAIQYWKSLPGSDYPEPSEAGSSTKENFCGGDYADLTSASDGGWKDNPLGKVSSRSAVSGISTSSTKKRTPLAVRKTCLNYVQSPHHSKTNDWHIEIALPKTLTVSLADAHNEESEGSCVTKTFERASTDAKRVQNTGYDYVPMDDKPECSSMSDIVSGSFETKEVTVAHSCHEEGNSLKAMGMNQRSPAEEIDTEDHISLRRMQERKSLDSTVTELSSRGVHGCCLHYTNELAFIRQKLLEIETKQSNLLDLIQAFMGSTMDGLTMLQSKVLGLEHTVDTIAQDLTGSRNHSNMASSKHFKNSQSISSSPRLSNCTPRPSVDTSYRMSSLSLKSRELWEETTFTKSRSSTSVKQGVELWRDPTVNMVRNPLSNGNEKNIDHGNQSKRNCQSIRTADRTALARTANNKQNILESKNSLWKRVKDFLGTGDLEAAFVEALSSGDVLVLIELMDRTGPVLERLSHETAGQILRTLASNLLDQRFLDSIIPWLHQVVDLSTTRKPDYLVMSPKARREFLSAIQEAAAMDFCDPADRRSITELALKLRLVWGKST
ncbi:TORTIFOLIA1-like protein 2 [Magnolia sinica]|uniref:TORTIFOLIA1-like protein 2 n=1 Tax=Magnolia sinica TaxID=86752 RepID=UPI002658DDB6|nr:TORTIFOLIA1-like protein 2 [Magnolia sinica]